MKKGESVRQDRRCVGNEALYSAALTESVGKGFSLCLCGPLCLCGEITLGIVHHRVTEIAQRHGGSIFVLQTLTGLRT
jgi:hypothetical protein